MSVENSPEAEVGSSHAAPIGWTNAGIAARYDEVPYVSHPFPMSHPGRLAAVAQLFGLQAPRVETARILEVGCASGGNIIPLAACYPGTTVTGLELSGVQAGQGAGRILRLGLPNARIIHGDVLAYAPEPGQFDYILCHGVYSWAPPEVRAAILRVVAQGLAPDGIAHVSFNVLPGWRSKQALRDAMMSRLGGISGASAQIAEARAFLAEIKGWKGSDTSYHRALLETAEHAAAISDDYMAHEFLETFNEPQTFTQFADECKAASLAYLGESELWTQLAENYDPSVQPLLRRLSGNQAIAMEQAIDVISGRTFRQSLLVHEAHAAKIDRTITRDRMSDLHYLGPLTLQPEPSPGYAWTFAGRGHRTLSTGNTAVRQALELIIAREPASTSYAELLTSANTADHAAIVDALFKSVTAGVLDARTVPVDAASALAARPIAPAWCRSDVSAGEVSIANLRHESVNLDVVGRALLPLLDGNHDWQDLCAAVLNKVAAGEIRFLRDAVEVHEPDGVKECATDHVSRTLTELRSRAVLSA